MIKSVSFESYMFSGTELTKYKYFHALYNLSEELHNIRKNLIIG